MDPISGGCRLCLDPFVESFTTIDSPELKDQMEKVFLFPIESKEGYCSDVCQSCSYTISEFYQYSEKVRQNQELLEGNVTNIDPMDVDSKISFECIKVETLIDSMLPEKTEIACEPKEELSGEEDGPDSSDDDSCDPPPDKLETKPQGRKKTKLTATKHGRDEQDQLFNQHFKMDCDLCGMSAGTYSKLTYHFRKEHKRWGAYVVCCNKKFFKRCEIQDHIDFHANPELFRCEVCGHKYTNKVNLNIHMQYQHSSESLTQQKRRLEIGTKLEREEQDQLFNAHFSMVCDLCGMATGTFTELTHHFRTEHKRSGAYVVCCDKKLFKRFDMRDHIESHTNPDVFRCKVCGIKYKSTTSLNAHMHSKHTSEEQGLYKCDHCPKVFAKKFALNEHIRREVEVKCPKCDLMLGGMHSLRRHMAEQHSDKNRTMVCDTCGKVFLCPKNFKLHINEHNGIKIPRFQCEICHKWLKGNGSLRSHMKFIHTDKLDFQCDVCPQKFPHNRALTLHKFHAHTDKTHKCEFCGRTFKKAITLKEHRATHTGEVLYSCKHCGIPKKNISHLYQHIKKEHPMEWAQKKIKAAKKRVNKNSISKVD